MNEIMGMIAEATITVSVLQITIMIIMFSLCLLFRFNKLGLLLAYLYTFHMGWTFCQAELIHKGTQFHTYAMVYVIFGMFVLFLSIVQMFQSQD